MNAHNQKKGKKNTVTYLAQCSSEIFMPDYKRNVCSNKAQAISNFFTLNDYNL